MQAGAMTDICLLGWRWKHPLPSLAHTKAIKGCVKKATNNKTEFKETPRISLNLENISFIFRQFQWSAGLLVARPKQHVPLLTELTSAAVGLSVFLNTQSYLLYIKYFFL